jgi:methylthioribose-1-phosphate isomerase
MSKNNPLRSVYWDGNVLKLLDQRLLPDEILYLDLETVDDVWQAIKHLKVRGAPAIGIAAAYGLYLGVRNDRTSSAKSLLDSLQKHANHLSSSRPTAVNLFWAIERIVRHMQPFVEDQSALTVDRMELEILSEAERIRAEDEDICRKIGEYALPLFHDGIGILTHCNAGGLATARYGTALAPMYLAHEAGWQIKVFADETRPVLQGARLTAFELQQAGIDVTLICDNMAAMVMAKGWIQAVIVGTDRVAANGDVANKIGTYGLAVLAKAHQIPFYVACPLSTIDLNTPDGTQIPIEERDDAEITEGFGKRTAPDGVKVFNPAFDVTPNEYVTAIITEKGILRAPYSESLPNVFK